PLLLLLHADSEHAFQPLPLPGGASLLEPHPPGREGPGSRRARALPHPLPGPPEPGDFQCEGGRGPFTAGASHPSAVGLSVPARLRWSDPLRRLPDPAKEGLHLKGAVGVGILLLGALTAAGAAVRVDQLREGRAPGYHLLYLPSGRYLRAITFGYEGLAADLI